MECPLSECDGQLILVRQANDFIGDNGTVKRLDPTDWEDEYIVCMECGDLPTFTWNNYRIVLAGGG